MLYSAASAAIGCSSSAAAAAAPTTSCSERCISGACVESVLAGPDADRDTAGRPGVAAATAATHRRRGRRVAAVAAVSPGSCSRRTLPLPLHFMVVLLGTRPRPGFVVAAEATSIAGLRLAGWLWARGEKRW